MTYGCERCDLGLRKGYKAVQLQRARTGEDEKGAVPVAPGVSGGCCWFSDFTTRCRADIEARKNKSLVSCQ